MRLLTWSEETQSWLEMSGEPAVETIPAPDRELTRIQSGGEMVAALEHDVSALRRPERLQAVASAVGLALEIQRLNAQVLEQLDDVTASRARVVESADTARRRIERDLHDGAQQRLVALGLLLQRGQRRAARHGQADFVEIFDSASAEVREALAEIREVSHGSPP